MNGSNILSEEEINEKINEIINSTKIARILVTVDRKRTLLKDLETFIIEDLKTGTTQEQEAKLSLEEKSILVNHSACYSDILKYIITIRNKTIKASEKGLTVEEFIKQELVQNQVELNSLMEKVKNRNDIILKNIELLRAYNDIYTNHLKIENNKKGLMGIIRRVFKSKKIKPQNTPQKIEKAKTKVEEFISLQGQKNFEDAVRVYMLKGQANNSKEPVVNKDKLSTRRNIYDEKTLEDFVEFNPTVSIKRAEREELQMELAFANGKKYKEAYDMLRKKAIIMLKMKEKNENQK